MKFKNIYRRLLSKLYWKFRLGSLGSHSILFSPILISDPRHIFIGDGVCIRDNARLEIVHSPGANWVPKLSIGNNVNIEQGVHIVCQASVIIEDNVSITPYCAIVDTYHPNDPPDVMPKIGERLPDRPTHVRIGAGSFIGIHSTILPNVTIGRGCVIGAGSVVTSDVPDYCVAAGVPARVIRQYDPTSEKWH
jgi:acetyltransferase-like isoleucine patch superfamily enzyme